MIKWCPSQTSFGGDFIKVFLQIVAALTQLIGWDFDRLNLRCIGHVVVLIVFDSIECLKLFKIRQSYKFSVLHMKHRDFQKTQINMKFMKKAWLKNFTSVVLTICVVGSAPPDTSLCCCGCRGLLLLLPWLLSISSSITKVCPEVPEARFWNISRWKIVRRTVENPHISWSHSLF